MLETRSIVMGLTERGAVVEWAVLVKNGEGEVTDEYLWRTGQISGGQRFLVSQNTS